MNGFFSGHLPKLSLFLSNMRYVLHLGLTCILAGWAFILFLPVETFARSQSYAEFARICPNEDYWAYGFAFGALVGAAGCWASWPLRLQAEKWNWVRVLSALVLGLNHGMIALLTLKGNSSSTGNVTYSVIMLMAYALAASEAERIG